MAKDCHKKKVPATSKGEDASKTEKSRGRRNLLYATIVRAGDILHVSALVMPCSARQGHLPSMAQENQ